MFAQSFLLPLIFLCVASINACQCKSKPRHCVFVHGSGQKDPRPSTQNFPDYWGNIEEYAPCCKTIEFLHLDTVNKVWYDDENARAICRAAVTENINYDSAIPQIKDTILVSHSMGNMMIAHMIDNICSVDRNTTEWIALQGPFQGSIGSHKFVEDCKSIQKILGPISKSIASCDSNGNAAPAYAVLVAQGGKYSTHALDNHFTRAQRTGQEYITAALCGDNPRGILSIYSFIMEGLAAYGNLPKESDGLVPYQSCISGTNGNFSTEILNNRFYRGPINHLDGSFRTYDNKSAQPKRWFNCLL